MGNLIIQLAPTAAPTPAAVSTPHTNRTTVWDLVERLMSSLGGNPVTASDRDFKSCILDAAREFGSVHQWNYLVSMNRIPLDGLYNSGTIAVLVSSGSYPNQVTLSGFEADGVTPAAWPSWALYASLRIGTLVYQVKKVISSTVLLLDPTFAPTADVAAGTSYSLAHDTYTLPADFTAGDRGLVENNWGGMSYMRPHEWLTSIRYLESYGQPRLYTFRGDPHIPGRMALSVYPLPDVSQSLDFIYRRRMRDIQTFQQTSGTASVTLAAPTTVTLSGGTFLARHVGAVIRFASSGTDLPTGREGEFPFAYERNILEIINPSTATIDDPLDVALTAVPYRISDPIDLEDVAMLNAFIACAMKFLGRVRRFKPAEQQMLEQTFLSALDLAKEADDRDMSRRAVELFGTYPYRLRDMPRGPDIS